LKNQRLEGKENIKVKGEKKKRKEEWWFRKKIQKNSKRADEKKKKLANQRSLIPRISKFENLDFRCCRR
jgi:hypothetical protein